MCIGSKRRPDKIIKYTCIYLVYFSGSVITAENTSVLFESPNKVVVTILVNTQSIDRLIKTEREKWSPFCSVCPHSCAFV